MATAEHGKREKKGFAGSSSASFSEPKGEKAKGTHLKSPFRKVEYDADEPPFIKVN